ncbi:Uma2 family endonuclease [bacterium]|nr:Uma2 family endonuclease [Chloroflexi bacterium CFX6]RIL11772.1 MAG: Uma2 family endonuclease [bacterium]
MTKIHELATGQVEIDYPESDGKPMAETDLHRDEMVELIGLLKQRYADVPDVYVSGNLLLYYEEGNPRASVAPDVFVVFGVPKARRRVYKLWSEGVPPAVVIEVTSRKTRREDLLSKMALYAELRVAEYYLYDPAGEYLRPPLQGFRLEGEVYAVMAPDESGALRSERLAVGLRLDHGRLELLDPVTGQPFPRPSERAEALAAAERALDLERRRAERAEADLARLRIELDRRRAGG